MRLSGVRTKKDTVNTALREYAARHRGTGAPERYAALGQEWDHGAWEQRHRAEKAEGAPPAPGGDE